MGARTRPPSGSARRDTATRRATRGDRDPAVTNPGARLKGRITAWNDAQGFGFITPLTGGKRVFVPIKAFGNRARRPAINQVVTYTPAADRQGRPCATHAALTGERPPQRSRQRHNSLPLIGAVLFLLGIAALAGAARLPPLLLAGYLIASLLTFIVYAVDKSAARKGAWRTPESTLHLLSLAGGWPGAVVAQQGLRHKSVKPSFRAAFRLTVLANCIALAWLLTPAGSATLRSLLARIT